MAEVRVAVVHGKHLIREGIAQILRGGEITIVAVFKDVQALLARLGGTEEIDVFIVAASVNGVSMEAAVAAIKKVFPDGKVIILSDSYGTSEQLADAYAAGAVAFLTTDTPAAVLIEYVRLGALGARAFPAPPDLVERVGHFHSRQILATHLRRKFSEREQDILKCLAAGHSNKGIARALSITESTVKAHVRSILRKLGAENRTQAAIWATSAVSEPVGQAE